MSQDLISADPDVSFAKHPSDLFLRPGEYFVGSAGRVGTLLGSCVSITLWHPRRRIGAMSHFLLAERGAARVGERDGRYGDEVLTLMLDELAARDVRPEQCEAKIFGGGDMFPGHGTGMAKAVGQRNGEAARRMLEARGIAVRSRHLFGAGHRQIVFDVANGNVWVRHVAPATASAAGRGKSR
jgi:chemotaxis protein CheD